mgnify:CR=1 FL=1
MSTKHYTELVKEYRKFAKRADQRLVRLEALSREQKYENVLKYAYAVAAKNIESYGKTKGRPRFNTKPPTNTNTLQAKINDIKHFLGSVSSTKKGIMSTYEKRADILNKNMGLEGVDKFTWYELADFFQTKSYEKIASRFGSDTAFKTIGKIKENLPDIAKAIKDNKKIKVADWKVNDTINKMIAENDIKLADFGLKDD